MFCAGSALAQKGIAERDDYYPLGYALDTWTGEVTAFDSDQRTLTLTHGSDKKASTFVATLPNAPYEWGSDARHFRVVDFAFDKEAKSQTFIYVGVPGSSYRPAGHPEYGHQKRPNPPSSNVLGGLSQFMGHGIIVYYTVRERVVDGGKEKYNDMWRIRILTAKKT